MGEIFRENQNIKLLLEMSVAECEYDFTSTIVAALNQAELEIHNLDETIESIQSLKPNCDKLDYILAASSGALCGIIDIFLVGKPGESPLGNITDKWFANRTTDFAKLCGWEDKGGENSLSSAIRFLENKFKIPYEVLKKSA
ncbi:hypothetical protein [Paenibacillus cremeus]|uniref:hypothetical protein n=1 Tax=Paenibacillus cremeus TaxID=2163881 RepID=UPI0016463685|nr:hypothetical protein [Paenibacillus cremeus]